MPELTEEQLKNMSPEEIAALQKQNCVFCHIVKGKVAARKVFEDDKCLAILDINPANPGHILLLTKEHYQIMPQVPEDVIGHLFKVIKHLSQAALRSLGVKGTTIFVANGLVAGQRAPHFMMHVIPRKEGDGLKLDIPKKKMSEADQEMIYKRIKERVNAAFGVKEEAIELPPKPEKVVDAEFKDEKTDLDKIAGLFS
ncbi:MAG: HIT family protein [Candidatus Woesearchaeota archaeon]